MSPRAYAAAAAFILIAGAAGAAPYVPAEDAAVLERLPEKGDPRMAQLKRMRATLASSPRDLDLATAFARHALDAARERGDPRFAGQAQAALGPWWNGDDVPLPALLLRATIKQSLHDFRGALADLDRLLARHPAAVQARLTRATVRSVVGRYADARADCTQLAGRVAALVVAGCDATPASLTGHADAAYGALVRGLAEAGGDAGVREWALTLAAEIAARRGDPAAADRHFRAALGLASSDPYLKGAYADFLLDQDRANDVVSLLGADTRIDALLLRLALAEQRLPQRGEAFAAHRAELAARFAAAKRRGDDTHRREEARFRLAIEGDAARALALARDNWAAQREPADLRILIEAARAAGDADALAVARDWIAAHRLEDRGLHAAFVATSAGSR